MKILILFWKFWKFWKFWFFWKFWNLWICFENFENFENFDFFSIFENFHDFWAHLQFEPQGARNGIRRRYYHRWTGNCPYFWVVSVPRTSAVCAHIRHTIYAHNRHMSILCACCVPYVITYCAWCVHLKIFSACLKVEHLSFPTSPIASPNSIPCAL